MDDMSADKLIPLTPPIVPVDLPSDLLQRWPDVLRAERELAAATARIGVAKADLFPKFSLTGIAGLESISANNWFDYASRYWSAGPTVQWELFEAGRIRANVRVQNARQEQALDAYQQTLLTALENVENALTAYARNKSGANSCRNPCRRTSSRWTCPPGFTKAGWRIFCTCWIPNVRCTRRKTRWCKVNKQSRSTWCSFTKRSAAAGRRSPSQPRCCLKAATNEGEGWF